MAISNSGRSKLEAMMTRASAHSTRIIGSSGRRGRKEESPKKEGGGGLRVEGSRVQMNFSDYVVDVGCWEWRDGVRDG